MRQTVSRAVLLLLLLVPLFAVSASLSSAEEFLLTKTETPVVADFSANSQRSSAVCSYGIFTDSVTLKNKGTLPDTYTIAIDAAALVKDWIVVSNPVVSLAAGEEQTRSLYIRTPHSIQGTYFYNVLVASTYDGTQKIEKTITATPCVSLVLKSEKSDSSSAVYMLYATYLFYTILCILAVAVLVVVILVVKRTAGRFGRWLKRYQFLLPLCLGLGVLFLVIGAFAYPLVQQHYQQQEESLTTPETPEETNNKDKNESLFTPRVTAVILGSILILLGVLSLYWKRRLCYTHKKNVKWAKEESIAAIKDWCGNLRSEETAARVKPVLKFCWMTLLLLFFLIGIGAGLYFIYPNIVVSDGASEESEPSAEASEETTMESDTLTESLSDLETKYATLEEQLNNMQEEIDALQKEKEVLEKTVVEIEDTAPLLEVIDEEKNPADADTETEIPEASSEEVPEEETVQAETTQEETSETVVPVFDVESEAQGNFFIDIPKNTAYRIDLNAYFVDEDADPLVYTATTEEHLSALVEEQFVTLTPEIDWTGESWVRFTADDSNGGVVGSPTIRVMISENDVSPKEMNYIPWIILGSIIVLIIVSLISGAFAKKFHRDPGMPPEEE